MHQSRLLEGEIDDGVMVPLERATVTLLGPRGCVACKT